MLKTVLTEFWAPTAESPEWGMEYNADDQLRCKVHGYFEQSTLMRTLTVYGSDSVRSWRWYGKLPVQIEPTSGWRLKATVQGKDREFEVTGAVNLGTWTVELTEVQ